MADTTIGISRKTREILGNEQKNSETLEETINRLIQQNQNGRKCPDCGSKLKVTAARPFNLFMFDLKCSDPDCDYKTEFEALKGVEK